MLRLPHLPFCDRRDCLTVALLFHIIDTLRQGHPILCKPVTLRLQILKLGFLLASETLEQAMFFQSGVLLPFFMIGVVIVVAFFELMGTSKSTSVMTERPTGPFPDRQHASGLPQAPRPVL